MQRTIRLIGMLCVPALLMGLSGSTAASATTISSDVQAPTQQDATVQAATSTPTGTYTVKAGDTLWAIARQYRLDVATLATLNHLPDPNMITPGQVLQLPTTSPPIPQAVYTVVKGDTLSAIAATYHTTVTDLASLNHISDVNLIFPGQVLQLPPPMTSASTANADPVTAHAASPAVAHHPTPPHAAPVTAVRPAVVTSSVSGGLWACIRQHESGGNYAANTGNGYYGAYQFSGTTWNAMHTGYARADLAPPGVQDAAAQKLAGMASLHSQWPNTSRACGA